MEPQSESSIISMIQPRRLIDFLEDQNLPFPRRPKSKISVFIHAFSRRFSNKLNKSSSSRCPAAEPSMSRTTSVTVKDILRWKSFRDLNEPILLIDNNNNVPLPPSIMSPKCTSIISTTSSGSSPNSSWSSDFTVGDSPVWCRGLISSSDVVVDDEVTSCKKHFHVNVGCAENAHNNITKLAHPKDRIVHEEEEQFSPISVLDFTQQHEETFSSFHQSLVNMQRRNIMLKQRIQDFENLIGDEEDHFLENNDKYELNDDIESFQIEEKAIQLIDHVFKLTTTSSGSKEWDINMDCMLLDFFRDELITSKETKSNSREIESKILRMAKSWVKGEDHDGSLEWALEGTRQVCIQGMEKNENWRDFEQEQRDIAIEIEEIMLNDLLDELSIDLLLNI
uniref:uncharacterized protein LOC122593283 n=1 Tax=Erigeron canadensis TaxID=72917 RepID=UPI001CB9D4B3|nr:uncharacterized protein LOC122593283 [Erigeron canadensis]